MLGKKLLGRMQVALEFFPSICLQNPHGHGDRRAGATMELRIVHAGTLCKLDVETMGNEF